MTVYQKGANLEREVVNKFWNCGWAAMRAPASGTKKIPDIVAGDGKRHLAIELKCTGKDSIYIEKEEIKKLISFSLRFGAEAWVGVRFSKENVKFIRMEELKESNKNFVILRKSKGLSFEELIK